MVAQDSTSNGIPCIVQQESWAALLDDVAFGRETLVQSRLNRWSLTYSSEDIAQALNYVDKGKTVLHTMAERQRSVKTMLNAVLAWPLNLNVVDGLGCTPLMKAALGDNTLIVDALIKAGAHVDAQNHAGNTAVMIAFRNGREKSCRLLIQAGANLLLTNAAHETLLDYEPPMGGSRRETLRSDILNASRVQETLMLQTLATTMLDPSTHDTRARL